MSLMKRTGNNFYNLPALMDDFFSRDLFDWPAFNSASSGTVPAVNIKETPENFEVEMAAPGMKKEDFEITQEGNTLTIKGTSSDKSEEKDGEKYSRREFQYYSFQRSFTLPQESDTNKIQAKYENGLLKLVLPKREEAKQKLQKKIAIS